MRYRVDYGRSVRKDLLHIPTGLRRLVVRRILLLADNPRPFGYEKLSGYHDRYRIRQGTYRIVYTIEDAVLRVEIITVAHRSDVYRRK